MTHNHEADAPRSEAEALLPWYAAGTLSEAERALVERALAEDPALRDELAVLRDLGETVRESSDRIAAPAGDVDRVLGRIELAERTAKIEREMRGSLMERIVEGLRLAFAPPMARALATAAALAIVVQTVVIVGLVSDQNGGGYQMATAPAVEQVLGKRLIVSFSEAASVAAVNDLLQDLGARVVDGPNADGIYVIELTNPGADLDAAIADLRGRGDLVRFVAGAPQ